MEELRNWGVGELGSWGVGSWGVRELWSCGVGELGSWGVEELGSWLGSWGGCVQVYVCQCRSDVGPVTVELKVSPVPAGQGQQLKVSPVLPILWVFMFFQWMFMFFFTFLLILNRFLWNLMFFCRFQEDLHVFP